MCSIFHFFIILGLSLTLAIGLLDLSDVTVDEVCGQAAVCRAEFFRE